MAEMDAERIREAMFTLIKNVKEDRTEVVGMKLLEDAISDLREKAAKLDRVGPNPFSESAHNLIVHVEIMMQYIHMMHNGGTMSSRELTERHQHLAEMMRHTVPTYTTTNSTGTKPR